MTAWTDVIGWTLVHFVWEATLIGLGTAAGLRALRRRSAQARYVTACTGLLLAMAMPPTTAVVLLTGDMSVAPGLSTALGQTIQTSARDGIRVVESPTTGSASGRPFPLDESHVNSALSAFVAFWAAGVLLLTARLASGWWRVRRLHAHAMSLPASRWLAPTIRIGEQLGLARAIYVVDAAVVETPTVIGWLRPVILLPIAALANLTPAQVHAILAHELAHVRRHDFIVNLLQTIAETMLFYHPAVWWLSARIRAEREHCCDDIAVEICGDPVGYAEALTTIAAWGQQFREGESSRAAVPLAVSATSGSLLQRVRRLLRLPDEHGRRQPVMSLVVGITVVLVLLIATRLVIVAQTPLPPELEGMDKRLGPVQVNRLLGFDLFPAPVQYATDDPRGARAWDVKVAYPGGETSFVGFTGRSVIRFAYSQEAMPVVGAPSWLDNQSVTIRAETSTEMPGQEDFRTAIRLALEADHGISIRRDARLFPVYGLQAVEKDRLGPNIRPAEADCVEDIRARPDLLGPSLHARGQVVVPFCGTDNGITGIRGRRATLAQLARALRGFGMGPQQAGVPEREVVDQTGLTGVYDFDMNLGLLPLAAIATAHPSVGIGFGPMIRTFPQAIEEQLGLRLVPSEEVRDVVVVVGARPQFQANAATVIGAPGASDNGR